MYNNMATARNFGYVLTETLRRCITLWLYLANFMHYRKLRTEMHQLIA